MSFDPASEYIGAVSYAGLPSGKEYIEAIIEDAKKTLPAGTSFQFVSWTDVDTKRKTGWAYNLLTPRDKQKLFNPLRSTALKA